jgi:CDP-diacylglycerol--glycerol-3-phosphate 3-phosphatidyltransferase
VLEVRPDVAVFVGVLGAFVGSMGVYAAGAHRRIGRDQPDAGRGSFLVGPFLVLWFYWLIGPIISRLVALGTRPLFFNLAGVAMGAAAGVLFATGHATLAGWAVLLGGIADIFDGKLARTLNVASPWGAFLDATLDRFAEVAVFIGLAVFLADSRLGPGVAAGALGGSMLVSYTRARGEALGVVCKAGVLQRPERVLLLGFASVLDAAASASIGREEGMLLIGALAFMAVGTVGTAIFRTVWIARRLSGARA